MMPTSCIRSRSALTLSCTMIMYCCPSCTAALERAPPLPSSGPSVKQAKAYSQAGLDRAAVGELHRVVCMHRGSFAWW